jgi:hypothetical protein
MIQFSQPIQCLFCPQRRKIALIMKLLLVLSAAIITGLLLFPPRLNPSESRPAHLDRKNDSYDSLSTVDPVREPLQAANPKADHSLKRSSEIRTPAQKRSQDIQVQLKSMLNSEPPHLIEARKLLRARQRELLLDKILVLGEESFAGTATGEMEKKLVVQALDRELSILSTQLDLLAKTDRDIKE